MIAMVWRDPLPSKIAELWLTRSAIYCVKEPGRCVLRMSVISWFTHIDSLHLSSSYSTLKPRWFNCVISHIESKIWSISTANAKATGAIQDLWRVFCLISWPFLTGFVLDFKTLYIENAGTSANIHIFFHLLFAISLSDRYFSHR